MIEPICERGKVCVYLKKETVVYRYEVKGFLKTGKELQYRCNNLKRFSIQQNNILYHEQKYKKCGYKVTDLLENF